MAGVAAVPCEVCQGELDEGHTHGAAADHAGDEDVDDGYDDDDVAGARASSVCHQCRLQLCQRCAAFHRNHPALSQHVLHDLHLNSSSSSSSSSNSGGGGDNDGPRLPDWPVKRKKTSPQAAQQTREDLKQRAQRLRDRGAAMSTQTEHITNEFRAMNLQLQDAFADLYKTLQERQEHLTKLMDSKKQMTVSSLAQAENDRLLIKVTACSVDKVADTAPDAAVVAMKKSLTKRLDDVEKRPDVTSTIRPERLSFEESTLAQLKSLIAQLGQFKQEAEEVKNSKSSSNLKLRTTIRVAVPGVPGSCAWIQTPDQSERATGAQLARMLKIGHRVKRSNQWKSGNKDDGPGTLGTVRHVGTKSVLQGLVEVTWDTGLTSWHSMGRDNTYELELA